MSLFCALLPKLVKTTLFRNNFIKKMDFFHGKKRKSHSQLKYVDINKGPCDLCLKKYYFKASELFFFHSSKFQVFKVQS